LTQLAKIVPKMWIIFHKEVSDVMLFMGSRWDGEEEKRITEID